MAAWIVRKAPKKSFTLKEKVEMIKLSAKGLRNAEIGRMLGVSRTTVSAIVNRKEEILREVKNATSVDCKKIRNKNTILYDMENFLNVWIQENKCRIPISQAIIQAKALSLFNTLKKNRGSDAANAKFEASRGWFQGFKSRTNLNLQDINVHDDLEATEIDPIAFVEIIQGIGCSKQQTSKADETAPKRKNNENPNEDDEFHAALQSSSSFVEDDENLSLGYSNEQYDDLPKSEAAYEDGTGTEKDDFITPEPFNRKRKKPPATPEELDPMGHSEEDKNTEFDIFGNGVAAQLNNLPFVNALELQLQIQQLITRYRIAMQNRGTVNMNSEEPKQNGATHEYEPTSVILSNKFDEQIFGDYVASSLRNLSSEENKVKLKRKIQKGIIEVSDGDKSSSASAHLKKTTETAQERTPDKLNDGIGTSNFDTEDIDDMESTIKEEPVDSETGLFVDSCSEDTEPFIPASKKRKTDMETESNLEETLNMISGNYLSDTKKAKEFELFGDGVAAQLNNMPFINAIELQSKIQHLISQYRLNYAHAKIKQLQT